MTDREALALLRGSPRGTTAAMAAALGIPRKQLERLCKAGKARCEHRMLAKPPMSVAWYFAKEEQQK